MARVDLNLSIEEFGKLTPKMFSALVDRLKARDQKLYLAAGIIASTISNTAAFGDPQRKAASPLDFIPGFVKQKPVSREMETEEQIAMLEQAFGCGPNKTGKGRSNGA